MRTREILIQLIDHLDQFEASMPGREDLSLNDFLAFINEKVGHADLASRNDAGTEAPWLTDMGEETETVIARLVTVMNRYAKSYIKRALQGSPIQTGEEFSFLLYLLTFDSLTKMELINKNIVEKTSGMEVIKRLIRQGLVSEFDDEEDKRSKRIALTAEGRNELLKILPTMHQVTFLVAGNLTAYERQTLAYLLKKLDHYHNDIFVKEKHASFDELTGKYLGTSTR